LEDDRIARDSAASWSELWSSGHAARFAGLCLGVWLHAADETLVATTMPRAVAEIGGDTLVSWAIALYQLGTILAGAATTLLAGRFGLRGAMAVAAVVYAVGCATSALSPAMHWLLWGRFVQGFGGGWLVALAYVSIQRSFPENLWPRLFAVMSAVWGTSAFVGPLIGGIFADFGLWRFAYWAFAGQALVLCALIPMILPSVARENLPAPQRLPIMRLTILASAILLIASAGVRASAIPSLLLCSGGLFLVWLFFRRDRLSKTSRMFPSRALDLRHQVGSGIALTFALGISSMSFIVYGPFVLDAIYGVKALTAGYIIAVEALGWTFAAVIFSGTTQRAEIWLIRAGAGIFTVAIVGFAVFMPQGHLYAVIPWAVLQGAGFGMMWGFIVRRVVAAVPADERDRASAAMPTIHQIAFAIGAASSGVVANLAGFSDGIDPLSAKAVAFWVFAAFIPITLLANIAAWRLTDSKA
jgi:MFS family permease